MVRSPCLMGRSLPGFGGHAKLSAIGLSWFDMPYTVTEIIHHKNSFFVRTTTVDNVDDLADWVEDSPYHVPTIAANDIAKEVVDQKVAAWGWNTYMLEKSE